MIWVARIGFLTVMLSLTAALTWRLIGPGIHGLFDDPAGLMVLGASAVLAGFAAHVIGARRAATAQREARDVLP